MALVAIESVATAKPLSMQQIIRMWWPLAAGWLLMTAELPLISAVIARLTEPKVNLAAWGIIFATSIIIQSPSTMLLAASTALSKDWDSYCRLRRFMFAIGGVLTMLHILLAFTPLYYIVMGRLMSLPAEIIEPARIGLMIMTPWSWGTAFRRFQQGVLIRFDHSSVVVWGSLLRVGMDSLILATGYWLGGIPGIVVGTMAIITGVVSEAIYTGVRVRPVLQHQLKQIPPCGPPLTRRALLNFYIPLAMTILLTMLVQPMISAALSRMPSALESLAVWPVIFGLLIMWQSVGIAYNEAVIALLDRPNAIRSLHRFTLTLAILITALLLIMAATPLATLWLQHIAALSPDLVVLAHQGLWIGLLLPGLRILQSWYQGAITYSHRTRNITEAVVLFLSTSATILLVGAAWSQIPGIYIGLIAFVAGFLLQTIWLWWRGRAVLQIMQDRDVSRTSLQPDLSSKVSVVSYAPRHMRFPFKNTDRQD